MNNYIIINLLRAGGDCGPQCVKNVAELTVYQYRIDALVKEIVFKHNPQGSCCVIDYEKLEIRTGIGPGRFLLVDMTEAQFDAYRALWRS